MVPLTCYCPGGICRKLYSPLESVIRVMCAPVALLSRATCAFGTTPPEGSLTEPRSDVSAVWPRSVSATTRIKPNDESFQFFIGDLLQTDLRKVTDGADCPRKET